MATRTLHDIYHQYEDNAGYQTLASARLYQESLRLLIARRPSSTIIDGNRVDFNMSLLGKELDRVSAYVLAEESKLPANMAGAVRTYDFRSIRD